jgi:23S rRNA (uracil1939-C5)-methyltransferase
VICDSWYRLKGGSQIINHKSQITNDLDVTIDFLNTAGDGVATAGGVQLTIPFTIPGERVRVQVGVRRQQTAAARLIEVLSPSPHRLIPRCPHFGVDAEPGLGACGGCTWQHIAYPEQLRLKAALVERLVRAAVPRAPGVAPMLPSTPAADPWGYRHKVHFVFGNAASAGRRPPRPVMGHYVRGTRRVIPVRECPVHDPRGNTLAFAFADAFARAPIPAADASGRGVLRGLVVRVGCNTDEIAATLVVSAAADRRLRTATRRAIETAIEPPTSLHVNVNPKDDGFIFGRETRRISGPARMREIVNGTSFVLSPTALFQTNVAAAATLATLVADAIPPGMRVLDLYAGAGLFALPLAARGHSVTAVEENRDAVADGEASLRLNRIPPERCRFIAKPVEAALRAMRAADAVILDPPREGCSRSVLDDVFARLQPRLAAYVSCNPEALARDLESIVHHGYVIRSIQPVDMFPHTAHIETVVVVTR